jgi:hypothetical protein
VFKKTHAADNVKTLITQANPFRQTDQKGQKTRADKTGRAKELAAAGAVGIQGQQTCPPMNRAP